MASNKYANNLLIQKSQGFVEEPSACVESTSSFAVEHRLVDLNSLNFPNESRMRERQSSTMSQQAMSSAQNSLDLNAHSDFIETLATFSDAQETLAVNGKSFRFAQRFLGKKTGQAAAKLYQFCRVCDDLVDEAPTEMHAKCRIKYLLQYLEATTQNADNLDTIVLPAVLASFTALKKEYDLPEHAVKQLLLGMQSDLSEKIKTTQDDLLTYCYRAAGTVGELMCPILDAPDIAKPYAIDLGVAMQLTNIARDVLEDAQNGRIYLPQDWLGGMSVKNILYPSPAQKMIICAAIKRCLILAEDYYTSALQGLQLVPWENRFAMHQALFIYREIGLVLAENDFDFQKGRIYVPTFDKLFLVFRHSYKLMLPPKIEPHQTSLHDSFRSLYVQPSNS